MSLLQDGCAICINMDQQNYPAKIVEQRKQETKESNKKRYIFEYDTGHHPMTLFDQKDSSNVLWQHFIVLHLIINI